MTLESTWRTQTHCLDVLEQLARDTNVISAMHFLVQAGVMPVDAAATWKRRNALPRLGIDPNKLTGEYLAEVAYEWDEDGPSSAIDFVEMLRAETRGHERDVIIAALDRLGKTSDEA